MPIKPSLKAKTSLNGLYSLLAVSIFTATACLAQTNAQNGTYAPLETIITDLNADNNPDTLQIFLPPVAGDPGQYRKINISLGVHGRNTFTAKDAWDDIDRAFLADNKNAVASNRVFVYKEAGKSLIFLWGFAYGSGREEFTIIQIIGNKMEVIFDNQIENPLKLADLDNDGHAELLCQDDPEMTTKTTGVYSPYLVYTFNGIFNLDKPLTEKYNRQHYVWAGFKYNEKIKVQYPADSSKPKIIR